MRSNTNLYSSVQQRTQRIQQSPSKTSSNSPSKNRLKSPQKISLKSPSKSQLTSPSKSPSNTQQLIASKKGKNSVRVLGGLILLIEIGLLFAYGFSGLITNELGTWGGTQKIPSLINAQFHQGGQGMFFYVTTMIFTLISFGCLYAAVSTSTRSGFFLSFFIVGFTTLLSPALQKFWYNVFFGKFNSGIWDNEDITGMGDYYHYQSTTNITIDFFDMRISLLNAISQLVVFYGLFQRLNVGQIFLFSTFYQFFWTLNYHLNTYIAKNQPDDRRRFMDDYAISQVFLFGSVFAVVVGVMVKKPPRGDLALGKSLPGQPATNEVFNSNDTSLITPLIGTFLLFITFMGITICFPVKNYDRTRAIWPEGYMNILFALCASVFTNIFVSSFTKNKIGLREVQFGMIGGAILAGPIAGTLDNIGAFMAMGTIAALLSCFYFTSIHPRINVVIVNDTYGAIYIATVSFIGTFFVAPLVLFGMVKNSVQSNLFLNAPIINSAVAGYSLIYVGISFGIALFSGILIGFCLRCLQIKLGQQFEDHNIFRRVIKLSRE